MVGGDIKLHCNQPEISVHRNYGRSMRRWEGPEMLYPTHIALDNLFADPIICGSRNGVTAYGLQAVMPGIGTVVFAEVTSADSGEPFGCNVIDAPALDAAVYYARCCWPALPGTEDAPFLDLFQLWCDRLTAIVIPCAVAALTYFRADIPAAKRLVDQLTSRYIWNKNVPIVDICAGTDLCKWRIPAFK